MGCTSHWNRVSVPQLPRPRRASAGYAAARQGKNLQTAHKLEALGYADNSERTSAWLRKDSAMPVGATLSAIARTILRARRLYWSA